MARLEHWARGWGLVLSVLGLCSCSLFGGADEVPPETSVSLALDVALDANRDVHGRPSPVIVRVVQLANTQRLEQVELFQSEAQAQQALGSDLLKHEQFQLRPGQNEEHRFIPVAGTRFLAVVVEYRDIDHAQWWAWAGIEPSRASRLVAAIGRQRVALTVAPLQEKDTDE